MKYLQKVNLHEMEPGESLDTPINVNQVALINDLLQERQIADHYRDKIDAEITGWSYERAKRCIGWLSEQPFSSIKMNGGRGNQRMLDDNIRKSVDHPTT